MVPFKEDGKVPRTFPEERGERKQYALAAMGKARVFFLFFWAATSRKCLVCRGSESLLTPGAVGDSASATLRLTRQPYVGVRNAGLRVGR
jgi:hypothetical protein